MYVCYSIETTQTLTEVEFQQYLLDLASDTNIFGYYLSVRL